MDKKPRRIKMSIVAERILFWKSSQAAEIFGKDKCNKSLFFWANHAIANSYYE